MRKYMRVACGVLITGAALALGVEARAARKTVELADAAVFIEWNTTDTDFGIQFGWDGEGWKNMRVRNHRGKTVLNVATFRNLRAQTLTEAAFESREPPADELSMEEFFDRFPEGDYTFRGRSLNNERLVGEAEFSHTLAEPTTIVSPTGGSTQSADGFTLEFTEVTQDIEGEEIEVEEYTIVIENTSEDGGIDTEFTVTPGETSYFIPGQFLTPDSTYKVEIIVQEEETGNRTITETGEFSTDSGDE